jgi:protein-export membrane protein SecD
MKKSIISVVVVFALTALFLVTALCGLNLGVFEIQSVSDGVPLGLDLVGGAEITYEAVGATDAEIADGIDSAVSMLRQRCNDLGYTEANVYQSGSSQIVVELPDVSDLEGAVQDLGTTAEIEFRDADGTVWLTGSDIKSATYEYSAVDNSGLSTHHVKLTFTDEGTEKFTEATKSVANRSGSDNYLDIVMDGSSISTPYVSKDEYAATGIASDTAIITLGSNATAEAASYLASIITAGQLPFSMENVKLEAVGAQLGEKSLSTSLTAGLIGLVLVMIFMIVVYRIMGVVSCISLVMYASLFCVVLSIGQVNLSLPGIAGIILTIGMAVDANVIIYERIKEELRTGKTLRAAVDSGYKHAVTAIIDANVTTLIAAVVLWWQGTGTIISFAKTLLIGVVLSMIIMLLVTKVLLRACVGLKIKNLRLYGV